MGDSKRWFRSGPDGETAVEEGPDGDDPVDEMTFSAHVLSLNATALMFLGELEADVEPDRAAARHIIDTLVMLRGKTEGNLSKGEARLLDSLLYELRLKFVQSA